MEKLCAAVYTSAEKCAFFIRKFIQTQNHSFISMSLLSQVF